MKKYGQTKTDKWANAMLKSRQIVSEIMNFGISQDQIHQIISLLSLELEDRDHMQVYREAFKRTQEEKIAGTAPSSKIILDS
tara:strand:- start:409 stop:654 length:246 start_codon:yes stop_codon:yes gene_type:complete